MKQSRKFLLMLFLILSTLVKSQAPPCETFLNDFIPKPTDSVLEVNVNFIIFSPSSGVGAWDVNTAAKADSCIRRVDSIYANIPMPAWSVPYVPYINNTRIKFKRKAFISKNIYPYAGLCANSTNYAGIGDSTLMAPFVDSTAINIYFGFAPGDTALAGTIHRPGRHIAWSHYYANGSDISALNNCLTIAHELGHALGLRHATVPTYSGNDTIEGPTEIISPGCCRKIYTSDYALGPVNPAFLPCGDPAAGNNMMSQNSGCNRYFSPQQMAVMHFHLRTDMKNVLTSYSYNNHLNRNAAEDDTISTNTLWTVDRYKKGHIIVKSGVTFTIGCLVGMTPGSYITVEKGAQLIVYGGKVTNISNQIWGGIQVAGDPNKDQSINPTTGVALHQGIARIYYTGATISNANNATANFTLHANGSIDWSSTGGIIIGTNANFINNLQDAEFLSYPNYASASRFDFCNFKTTAPIGHDSIIPYSHVTVWDNYGILFRACNFEYAAGSAYPEGSRGFGIHSMDAVYSIDQACNSTPSLCPTSMIKTTFTKLNTGLHVLNSNVLKVVNAINCNFYDNATDAAYLMNINGPIFNHNYISTPSGFNYSNGLYLNTCKYYNVNNNTLLQNSSSHTGTGMYVYNSQAGAHNVYHNRFSGFEEALNAVDNNCGNSSLGLKMNCNDFSAVFNEYDVLVLGTGSGFYKPSVMKKQGEIIALAANVNNVVRNMYAAPCGNQNKWHMEGEGTSTLVIEHGSNANAVAQPTPQPSCSYSNVVVAVISSTLNYVSHCPEYMPSTGSIGTNTSNPAQRLVNVNHYIDSLRHLAVLDTFEIQASMGTKLGYYLSDTARTSKDTVIDILTHNYSHMADADVQLVFAYMNKGDFTNAQTKADALPGSRKDWKNMLTELITIYQEPNKIFSINNNDDYKDFMLNWAASDRDGKQIAQALLSFVCGIDYDTPRPRPTTDGARHMSQNAEGAAAKLIAADQNKVNVYPNPSQTGVTVSYQGKTTGQALVEVKDLLGRLIYTNFINSGDNLYIPLAAYGNGVYIITITKDKELLYKTKLVKQD